MWNTSLPLSVAGIESKLDYIVELGAKTIWLSPIYKSPMKDFGYDIEDFKNVDESFGSLQDFKGLVRAMRIRGRYQVTVEFPLALETSA